MLRLDARHGVVLAALFGASLAFACGGGQQGDPKTPTGSSSSEPTSTDADAGPTTTTTVTLGDGGNLTGTKLETTTTVTASVDAGAKDAAAPPAGHDPGRSPQDIQTIIQARRDDARACYDTALKTHPGIEGNVDIKWTIDPKGVVTETSIDDAKSDIHEAGLVKCIGDVIKKISFAPSPRGVETKVHYPFNFHPRNAAPKP